MKDAISLIVGLGNPGAQYDATRHNAGFEYVDALARECGASWKLDTKYQAETCKVNLAGQSVWLMKPMTFMNRSGQSVGAFAQFFKIAPEQILVAHDELDLPPGVARFKQGGGHGGHNGLRDIVARLANNRNFYRLRLGIGHPGSSGEVVNYVLSKAHPDDRIRLDRAIEAAIDHTPRVVAGDWQKAMNQLHQFKAE
ncbi:aminoacyl-tRNA hydrolase [Saccharospirillum salsuginis]|uniref:Peptidyl-tRNA hydrolase n=1 Tax=Saccharospirillum salsuginis TaxID=418750 RepID=A0A918NJN1_9GAMM|nr:aminoacyl-tRNA hydrolase [Saccharospirillum salsuginis]GGX72845.1 peptidyl-tRNA hydrolase [Saccharospirillum salsuginis]